jgi:superoxide reductase
MEENHYIEWIELLAADRACRQFLKPGTAPEAAFCPQEGAVRAREYCSVHGLWEG